MTVQEARAAFNEADKLADTILRLYEQGKASRSQVELANNNASEAWDRYLEAKRAGAPAFVEVVR